MMTEQATRDAKNPYLRANSLSELLAWNDAEFIRCAYVTIVGRQPDQAGEAFYVTRLRRGHSKLEILWQLRRSPEGMIHDPGIAGLDRTLRRSAWERKPFLGALVRLVTRSESDDRWARFNRALLNELRLIREALSEEGQHRTSPMTRGADPQSLRSDSENGVPDGHLSPAAEKSLEIILGERPR